MPPEQRLADLAAITFDVDGVLTDGQITYTDDGRELKSFNVQDGAALKHLIGAHVAVGIITGRKSVMVERRAEELGIQHLYQGQSDKRAAFDDFLAKTGVAADRTAHVGDDLPDLVLFRQAGMGICVPNGHPYVQEAADWVTETAGGSGVAREIAEAVLRAKGLWSF